MKNIEIIESKKLVEYEYALKFMQEKVSLIKEKLTGFLE